MCWRGHVRETLQPLWDAYTPCLESGDPGIAANAALIYCNNICSAGAPVRDVLSEVNHYIDVMKQIRQKQVLSHLQLLRKLILCHMGLSPSPLEIIGDVVGGEKSAMALDNSVLISRKHLLNMWLNDMRGNHAAAVAHATCAIELMNHSIYIFKPYNYLTDSLMRIGLIDSYSASGKEEQSARQKIGFRKKPWQMNCWQSIVWPRRKISGQKSILYKH